jgi:hypothetical protein
MKKLNKKGIDYMAWFTLGFIFIFFSLITQLDLLNFRTGEIGITQTAIRKAQYNSEEILFLIDQAARYSIYNSIYSLAENGGFKEESKCGKYKNLNLWDTSNKDCNPLIEFNFGKYLQADLNIYIENARTKLREEYCRYANIAEKISLPKNNYDFLIESDENTLNITGIPTMSLTLDICAEFLDKKGNPKSVMTIGKFFQKPKFFQKIDYNFEDYKKIQKTVKQIIKSCNEEQDLLGGDSKHHLNKCVKRNIDPTKWKVIEKNAYLPGKEDRNFAFEFNSNKKMPFHDNNIIYKFAISIPDDAPPPNTKIEKVSLEGSYIFIEMKENPSLDIERYTIYFSKNGGIQDTNQAYKIREIKKEKFPEIRQIDGGILGIDFRSEEVEELLKKEGISLTDLYAGCIIITAADEKDNEIRSVTQCKKFNT